MFHSCAIIFNKCNTYIYENVVPIIKEIIRQNLDYDMALYGSRGDVILWLARLTRNLPVVSSSPIKGSHCFLELDTLPTLLSTGWFQKLF